MQYMKQIVKEEIVEISDTEYKAEFWYSLDGSNVIKKSKIAVTKGETKEHLENFKHRYNSIEVQSSTDFINRTNEKKEYESINESLHNYTNKTKVDVVHELADLQKRLKEVEIESEFTKKKVNGLIFLLILLPAILGVFKAIESASGSNLFWWV